MNTANESIAPAAFFVIRTPRLPLNFLADFQASSADTNAILERWLALDGVQEAIYLASPSLIERLDQWRSKPHSKQGKKVATALLKYMIRMCARPTPFGLFSGVHQGQMTDKTALISAPHRQDSRKTRLDMLYLCAFKEHIVAKLARSSTLIYRPNPSHYFMADQYRYIENYVADDTMQYRLSAVDCDEYFHAVLVLAKQGLSFDALTNAFCQQYPEAEQTEVEAYVQDLIDEKVLQADFPLPLTGESPDSALLKALQQCGEMAAADTLATALSLLIKLDNEAKGDIKRYKQIIALLQSLDVKLQESKLFQTDIYRRFEQSELSRYEIERVLKQLELIATLSQRERPNPLQHFVSEFNRRFEGQFVPLDVLLDDESGIGVSQETGYEAPLVAGLPLIRAQSRQSSISEETELDRIIEQALSLPENRSKASITLTSNDLKSKIKQKQNIAAKWPSSFALMISALKDQQDQTVYKLHSCSGPSSANLLGRFCHLNDELRVAVQAELQQEQNHAEDVIFAEIAHMPEGRPGNVIARPHLRDYEIVFMADSSLTLEYQITLDDLYVWIEGQAVKLWSKRLNKQIVPRLSCAHNYSARSLSAYKFLCMLQHQEGTAPNFSMPASTRNAVFVPRIMLDNLILNEKTWRIERDELAMVYQNGVVSQNKLNALLDKYQLDPIVSYAMSDNVLQLDLRHPDMLAVLLSETQGQRRLELKEVLTSQFTSQVADNQGRQYNNEIIVPVFNPHAIKPSYFAKKPLANIQATKLKRRFSAGSPWLSLKIYGGNSVVEQLLCEKLRPFIASKQYQFEKWFFIRYGDPDWHLRLRFFGEPEVLCGQLLPRLNELFEPMLESGELTKVELMTYEREVERYGGPDTMELVESLFMLDSELVAGCCSQLCDFDESLRWRLALLHTDTLLSLFEYDQEQRLQLLTSLRDGFGREFSETAELRKQLGERYRDYKQTIEDDFKQWLNVSDESQSDSQRVLFGLVREWQQRAQPIVSQLNSLFLQGQVTCSRDTLLGSLLHMHNNRLFKAYGREQEFVVHDLLRRKYFSSAQK